MFVDRKFHPWYNISDKELKKAPADPAERYAWAAQLCLQKVSGCTTDDVADNYDSLIEQSCKAAGISAQMASLSEKAAKARTKTSCASEIPNDSRKIQVRIHIE